MDKLRLDMTRSSSICARLKKNARRPLSIVIVWTLVVSMLAPTIALACEGGGPKVVAVPNSFDFKGVKVGAAKITKLKYKNEGPGDWNPTGVFVVEQFAGIGNAFKSAGADGCTGRIPEHAECEFELEFKPEHVESYEAFVAALPKAEFITVKGKGE